MCRCVYCIYMYIPMIYHSFPFYFPTIDPKSLRQVHPLTGTSPPSSSSLAFSALNMEALGKTLALSESGAGAQGHMENSWENMRQIYIYIPSGNLT